MLRRTFERRLCVRISAGLLALIVCVQVYRGLVAKSTKITQLEGRLQKCSDESNTIRIQLKDSRVVPRGGNHRDVYTGNIRRRHEMMTGAARRASGRVTGCLFCAPYTFKPKVTYDHKCFPLKSDPPITVCVQPPETEVGVIATGSGDAKSVLSWTRQTLRDFQRYLKSDERLSFIDVGAGIGMFTLMAAKMGRKVLAVEPNMQHVTRLHKAAVIQDLHPNITLLLNHVSDLRAELHGNPNEQTERTIVHHQGRTILMGGLAPHCAFKRALLRIDINGDEPKAFIHAAGLFDTVEIPVVLMKWAPLAAMYARFPDSADVMNVEKMLDFLLERDYTPLEHNKYILHVQSWQRWPDDVTWIHKDFQLPTGS